MIANTWHRLAARWHRARAAQHAAAYPKAPTPLDVSVGVTRMHLHLLQARAHGAKITTRRARP